MQALNKNKTLSKLLDFPVFSQARPNLSIADLPGLVQTAQNEKSELLELLIEEKPDFEAVHLPNADLLFAEEKCRLHQTVRKRVAVKEDSKIVLCNKKLSLHGLRSLIGKSELYSRFHLDSHFTRETASKIQVQQIQKGETVFIYGSLEDLKGLLVLSKSSKNTNLVLSIDLMEFMSIKIGKALLKRVEQYAKAQNIESIVTELPRANQELLAFYKAAKFKEQENCFIFHLWIKKSKQ